MRTAEMCTRGIDRWVWEGQGEPNHFSKSEAKVPCRLKNLKLRGTSARRSRNLFFVWFFCRVEFFPIMDDIHHALPSLHYLTTSLRIRKLSDTRIRLRRKISRLKWRFVEEVNRIFRSWVFFYRRVSQTFTLTRKTVTLHISKWGFWLLPLFLSIEQTNNTP